MVSLQHLLRSETVIGDSFSQHKTKLHLIDLHLGSYQQYPLHYLRLLQAHVTRIASDTTP